MASLLSRISNFLRERRVTGAGGGLRRTASSPSLLYGGTRHNWKAEAGDLHANSTVAICFGKILPKVQQSRILAFRLAKDASLTVDDQYSKLPALRLPNDFQTEGRFVAALAMSMLAWGMGYATVRRSAAGVAVGFWTWPASAVRVRNDINADGSPADGTRLITCYEIMPYGGGTWERYRPEDVIPFHFGIPDPRNPALSISPLQSLLRQVCTDNEAASFTAAILGRMAVPSLIISPKLTGKGEQPTKEQRRAIQASIDSNTGDSRGGTWVAPEPVDVEAVTMSPDELRVIETKMGAVNEICAALGIDPMVAGLPSSNKTYSNLREAREAFIEDCILPLLGNIASTLEQFFRREGIWRLAPDTVHLAPDKSVYRELDEDRDKADARHRENFKAGGTNRGEFRKAIGLVTETDDARLYSEVAAKTELPAATKADQQKRWTPDIRRGLELLHAGDPDDGG